MGEVLEIDDGPFPYNVYGLMVLVVLDFVDVDGDTAGRADIFAAVVENEMTLELDGVLQDVELGAILETLVV